MKSYIPNNINFRIVSSNALAKFKQDQAYDFNELNQNKQLFSNEAKEVILLEYDHWFKWLVRLEKIFLMLGEDENPEVLISRIDLFFNTELEDIKDVMRLHTEFFSKEITKFVENMHVTASKAFTSIVSQTLKNDAVFSAFPKIAVFISDYLQQLLMGMYEIQSILKNEKPFIKLTTGANDIYKISNICFIYDRIIFFRDKYNITEFLIVNLTSNENFIECKERLKNIDNVIIK